MQVGDDLRMNLNGTLTAGYEGNYGDQIPSTHGLDFGGTADLSGSYYNPNFLNFTATPYYNQSRADSNFQSLTDSTGLIANVNLFTGSHFPAYASYNYTRNSTGSFGLVGSPNFTTIGSGQGFGIGWSALIPDWPTFSVNYSQGDGNWHDLRNQRGVEFVDPHTQCEIVVSSGRLAVERAVHPSQYRPKVPIFFERRSRGQFLGFQWKQHRN